MRRQARVILAGVAALLAMAGLLRLGLIDEPDDAAVQKLEPAAGPAPARPAVLASLGRPEAEAIRAWLRQEMGSPVNLGPERARKMLENLDEDRKDDSKVVLFPSGRSIPKDEIRARKAGWEEARLWPIDQGLGEPAAAAALDLHNLRPGEAGFSALQRDRDYADGGEPSPLAPGFRLGAASLELPDHLKGDVARALFYMAVLYDGSGGGPDLELVTGASTPGRPELGRLCALLRWSDADPVDDVERRRNEWAARRQGTRNLFVERPEFARVLWGGACR
jgi:serine protease